MTPPPGGGRGPDEDDVKEGDEARAAVADAARRTISRRELGLREQFAEISPELGELDEDAFDELFEDDADTALSLLADLSSATDESLRTLARRLAGRVVLGAARSGPNTREGIGRLRRRPMTSAHGDLDLEASLDAIQLARASGEPPAADDLVVQSWQRPDTAVCLLIDRSGSMHGKRLAVAAVAAAAVVLRAPLDCSVVAFAEDAVVVKSQTDPRTADAVVDDLLRLRGFGVTDLALAVRVAARQLDRSRAARKLTLLLSDCRPTTGGEATEDARLLEELVVLAPADDTVDASAFAEALGVRWYPLGGPADVAASLAAALGARE